VASNPSIHPGIYLREECLVRYNLTVVDAAFHLGVSRQTLSSILSGRAGVSAEMAVRLQKVFGSSADTWLRRQCDFDLSEVQLRLDGIVVHPLELKSAAKQGDLFERVK
jgi:antitoxin HigA-1